MKSELRIVEDAERERVARWRSDAERHSLPTTNQRDNKGAPVLEVERIVKESYPPLPSPGHRVAWWRRLFRRGQA